MADNNEGEEVSQRGNEWEVVVLTESAYAAAPGPRNILDNSDINLSGDDSSETARAMLMSGHFGLASSVHENFPLEPEYKEEYSGKGLDHDVHQATVQQGGKSDLKQEGNLNIEGLISDEFSGVPQFYSSKLGDVASSKKLIDKEQDVYRAEKLRSYNDDDAAAGLPFLADEGILSAETFESLDDAVNPDVSNVHTHIEEDEFSEPADPWWRRHAASLYDHAKNVNPYWSIVVAAAVVGLVIIGRRWPRDKPQVFQLKSQLTIDAKGSHWIRGPITRLKDVTLGSRHSSYIGLSSLTEG